MRLISYIRNALRSFIRWVLDEKEPDDKVSLDVWVQEQGHSPKKVPLKAESRCGFGLMCRDENHVRRVVFAHDAVNKRRFAALWMSFRPSKAKWEDGTPV